MEVTKKQLIKLLSNYEGHYISGQELSQKLNISRSAVWKHMNNLKKDGYQIDAKTNKGYRIIEAPEQVSESAIQWNLSTQWLGKNIVYKNQVKSTQLVAHDLARENGEHGTVIVANEQTEGRGRMQRHWDSKKGVGLWFSTILRPHGLEPKRASQLTLVAAVAIANYFQKHSINVKIKWPNDIFLNGKKLAGILTEMQAEQDAIQYIVLGIGMNVNHTTEDMHTSVKDKATSLYIEKNNLYNLNDLLSGLLESLENTYDQFMDEGFSAIKQLWEGYAYKMGELIQIKTKEVWDATLIGIQEDGALIVKDSNGKIHELYSAEILW